MKQIIISIILVLFITLNSNAQNNNNYTVTSFKKLDNSMTARIDAPKKDKNGDICAVIKIVTTQTGFNFEGDGAGLFGSEYKTGEYWIWVGYGAKRITIKHPNLGVLRDYVYPISIEKATDYEMVLITGKITNTVVEEIESKWLLLTTKPDNAMIYLDNVFAGIGTSQKKLKPGKYEYRVEAPYYHNLAGIIEIKTENITKNIDLQPAFGFLQINSQPENGATIMIDGKTINRTTPTKTDTLASGEHTITITKQMFQPSSQKIIVKDNETTPLTLSMLPNFAEVEISTSNDAVIWIDNNEKGTGLWQGRLDAGIYTIEARKDKYISHKKDIEVKAGEKLKIELKPTPRYGKLDIITMPPMAIITINGKNYGTTPNTISDLLIGDYNLNLTKDGLESINKTISIYENKTTEVNEKLDSIKNILSDCSPKQLGINENKLNLIDSIANFGIKESAYPSCQILIAKDGLIFYNKSFGTSTYKSNNFVKNTDLYDISDITKVAATTIAIMKLYDDKKINLDKNLSFYLKYLKNTNKDGITIRQILSHQARLKEWIPFYKETLINGNLNNTIYSSKQDNSHNIKVANSIYILDNYKEKIIKSIIDSDIYDKEEYVYSDLGFYLLKELVEKISNQSFEQYLNDHFYSPLGLKHLCFNPLNKHQLDDIIPTGYDGFFRKQLIHAYAIDPGASMLGGIAGHSGLFSNAYDLAVIFQCLLQDGEYSGIKILNPSTIKLFTSQQYPENNNRRALGFDRQLLHPSENGPACKSASQLSYGHNGFTGTYVWIEPVEKILYIFLSNSINPDFSNDKLRKLNIIKNIHQIVYDILSENKKN